MQVFMVSPVWKAFALPVLAHTPLVNKEHKRAFNENISVKYVTNPLKN